MSTVIQTAIHYLLKEEPYYAHFILNSNVVYDRYGVTTAGATVIQGTPTFIFSTKYMASISTAACTEVLKHEVLHLVFGHVMQTYEANPSDRYLMNVAMDCTINQYLKDLPEGCVTLDSVSKAVGYPLLPFETSGYYYSHLIKKREEMKKNGEGGDPNAGDTLDEHNLDVPDQGNQAVNKAAVDSLSKKAVRAAAGNAPKVIVDQLSTPGEAVLPWKQILRNFVMSSLSTKRMNTTKKINRRFPLPIPGKKKKREMTLGLCLDESGSMSDEQLAMIFNEVKQISKQITKTWLIHADCEVAAVEDLSKVKLAPTRRAGGGTAYQPAIDKCVELKCDVIIYFGDFDTADHPVDPKRPFLWVGVGNQPPPAKFGKVLRLPG